MGDLTASQSALCDFLKLDQYIVEAAAKNSPDLREVKLEDSIENWLDDLSLSQCQSLLKGLLLDETGTKRLEKVLAILRDVSGNKSLSISRSSSDLKESACVLRAEGERKVEQERREKLDKYIVEIAAKEPAYWQRVDELFEKRGSSSVYDELVTKLRDLHLVAVREDKVSVYKQKVGELQTRYMKKQSHWRALRRANFEASIISGK